MYYLTLAKIGVAPHISGYNPVLRTLQGKHGLRAFGTVSYGRLYNPELYIRVCGRATQGVRLMRVDEGSRIVGVARAEAEEEDEDSEE